MTRAADIAKSVELGVDAFGLIFYPNSSRFVSFEEAKNLTQNIPPFVDIVGVFVNPDTAHVSQCLRQMPITLLQFHGDEKASFCEQFEKPYIKAIQVHSSLQIESEMKAHHNAIGFLLDTPSKQYGGAGVAFDWSLIPKNVCKPLILAGGLTHENVGSFIKKYAPYAVDVCSGIESAPGIKDEHKMKLFVKALRENT